MNASQNQIAQCINYNEEEAWEMSPEEIRAQRIAWEREAINGIWQGRRNYARSQARQYRAWERAWA